ncbi:class I SAM-dependent methyltransferase [Kineococcus sp. SYSU DK003]|uniref:class I SAM-dependent methyltransferase n=1 Tax=Kineococcus sp. SYSU DK003 TaxID=3383124 RepID=UPI003D7D40CE
MPDPFHFDVHAEVYDRARPPYPEALWRALAPLLGPGVRVLELGAGSGLATGPLLAAGAEVTAVEPGPALAARLRARHPAAVVLTTTAEAAPLPAAAFDLAAVATAVHWLDLDVVLPKLHTALVPGGHLAVWRNAFGDPQAAPTAFRRRVAQITARREEAARPGPGELDTGQWARQLSRTGHFTVRDVQEFRWSVELTGAQVRDLFTTFSNWSAAEAAEAAAAVDELGGTVREHYLTPLILLRRNGPEL